MLVYMLYCVSFALDISTSTVDYLLLKPWLLFHLTTDLQ